MKALVTGAAGFIGSTLVNRLQKGRSNAIVAVDTLTDYYSVGLKRRNLAEIQAPNVEIVQGDLNELDLDHLMEGVEVVFHEAGQPGVRSSWGSDFGIYISRNIEATQRLLEAAKRSTTLQRFVYASSSSVYGDAERYPTRETDRPMPRSPYGVTKLAAEHLCSLYGANFGVPTVSLRYFTVYGPRQRPDMAFTRFINAAISGDPVRVFGTGGQIREFTYVEDIVSANVLAAETDLAPGTVLNLSGGTSISVNEVLGVLEDIHGRHIEVERIEAIAGDVFRTGGSTELAQQKLGWSPEVAIRDGLAAEYDWLKQTLEHGRS